MDDSIPRSIITVLCLIPIAGFFAGCETAFSFCNEARMRALAENGSHAAKRLVRILDDFDRTIVTLLIIINILYILSSSIATVAAIKLFGSIGSAIATVVTTLFVFLCAETIPKNIARANSDRYALIATYPITVFRIILAPFSAIFTHIGEFAKKLLPEKEALPDVTEDEFEEMIESVEDEDVLEPVEKDIIKSTIHFGDILSGNIMTPLEKTVCVDVNMREDELKALLREEKYSRFPVYEGDMDHVVGILHASKLLSHLTNGTFGCVADLMTRPYIIRPDIPVSKVFEGMSGRRTHMAIVADSGKTLGVITMEDILEEIVGEIYDEDDEKGGNANAD